MRMAFRQRPFALLWAGQTASRLGDSLYSLALAWWVLEKTGSATAMGVVLLIGQIPMLVFLLIGGVAVDRLPRLAVMMVSDLLSGVVVVAIAILAHRGSLQIRHVYLASAMFGLTQAFFFPAFTASVPDLAAEETLPGANALISLSQQLAQVVGPALGAWIVARGGTPTTFALDGISFILASALLVPLTRAFRISAPTRSESPLSQFRQGISLVFGTPWLWLTIAIFALVNVAGAGPFAVGLPFLIKQARGLEVGALGLVTSAASAGAVCGALWLGRYAKIHYRGWLAYSATAGYGLMILLIGVLRPLPAMAAAALIAGTAISLFGLIWTNTLQTMVPREALGRVSSIDALGSFALLPLGFAAAGLLTDRIGPENVFVLGGSLTILLAVTGLLHPAVRALD
jgi:MFS family permease